MDLAQILQDISGYVAGVTTQTNTVKSNVQQNQELRQQGVDALQRVGELKQEQDASESEKKLKMEERKAAVAQTFDVDILNPDNRLAILARQQADEIDAALAHSRRASELNTMNIFDSPLEYMVQRPFAYRNAAEAEAAGKRAVLLDKAIDDLNQQAQQSVLTQKAINQEFTLADAARNAEMVKMDAEQAIRVARINSNQAYFQDLESLRKLDKDGLQMSIEAYKLKRHEEEFQARMAEMKAAREARAKQKFSEEEQLAYQYERYNLGADKLRVPKAANLADFSMLMKKYPKQVAQVMEQGNDVMVTVGESGKPTIVQGRVAPTAGEAIVAINSVGGAVDPSAEKVGKLLKFQQELAIQELRKSGVTKFTQDDVATQVNRQLYGYTEPTGKGKVKEHTGLIKQMAADVERDVGSGVTNIFKAPSPEVIASVVPSLASDPLWNSIVTPAQLTGKVTVTSMLLQSKLAILERKATVEQAAKFMSQYYGAALLANRANEKYSMYAIPENYNTAYRASVPRAGNIDATSEASLKRAMIMNFSK
jgi:hypothetical protein